MDQGLNYAQWGFPLVNQPFYLSWDQRHTLKANVTFELPSSIIANFVWQYHSGRPYTYYPSNDGFTVNSPKLEIPFLPNNKRMPYNNFFDIKLSKEFQFGPKQIETGSRRYKVAIYVDVRNLFNEQNVRWMDSSGRIGGELNDPAAYYIGRRIAVGMNAEL